MTPSGCSQSPASLPTPLWAAQVAAATPLPDARLNTRLEYLLTHLADKPLDAFPQAMPDCHQAKATYRFLANERVPSQALVTGLRATTAGALSSLPLVYVIHDTATFSYSSLKHTTGLGYVNDSETARGLHCHSSLAIRPDGVALGLLHQHYWVRLELRKTRTPDRDGTDKESIKWVHGLDGTRQALDTLPVPQRPRVIHIMDREGDIHDVFAKVLSLGHGAVIRRYHPRLVAEEPGTADAAIGQAPVRARVRLKLPASHGRKARTALVELRSQAMTLLAPAASAGGRQPLRLTMVAVREVGTPVEGDEPITWLLWTTEPAQTKKQLLAVVQIYALRWRIEDFHLVWKQGCRVEHLQLETRERLEKALLLYAGVAVRLLRLRDLARKEPHNPCTEVLSTEEWRVLFTHVTGEVASDQTPIPTIEQATKWLGRLGGHLGRKRDGMPGVRTLWRGWRDLAVLVAGCRAGRKQAAKESVARP
jgi:hypothetical protein